MVKLVLSKEVKFSIKECLLNIFWPKIDIIDFFKSCGCSGEILQYSLKAKDELSRKEIVLDVFSRLENKIGSGEGEFLRMANELKNWSTFTDKQFLQGGALCEKKAVSAIKHLKYLCDERDKAISAEMKRRKEAEQASRQTLCKEKIKLKFNLLYKGFDEDMKPINAQKRGYIFESLLKELFEFEGIETPEKFSLSITGEQIDGAIKHDGEHYIIEAKWQENDVASNALYQFSYKIEGKMYGRGLFISINGFSPDSVQALVTGKAVRAILIDGHDLTLVLEGYLTFKDLLNRKIGAAQTKGLIYVNPFNMLNKMAA